MQLALDEVAMERAANDAVATARVYEWAPPGTVSLGYSQDIAVLDRAYCRDEGLTVTRRMTGGGTIYHDANADVAFAVALPRAAIANGIAAGYRVAVEPVLDALRQLGVPAELADADVDGLFEPACYLRRIHGAYDIVVPDSTAAGGCRKIAGCAQHRGRNAILVHGSLRYVGVPDREARVFRADIAPDAVDNRTAAVLTNGGSRPDLLQALSGTFMDWLESPERPWASPEIERAETLVAEKYANEDWVRTRQSDADE